MRRRGIVVGPFVEDSGAHAARYACGPKAIAPEDPERRIVITAHDALGLLGGASEGASTTEVLHEAGATRGLHHVIGVDEHAVCTWPVAEDTVALHGLNRRRPRAPRHLMAADEILLRKARTWRSVSTDDVRATASGTMLSRRRARRARARTRTPAWLDRGFTASAAASRLAHADLRPTRAREASGRS